MKGERIYKEFEMECKKLIDIEDSDIYKYYGYRDVEMIKYARDKGIIDIAEFERFFAQKYSITENTVFDRVARLRNKIRRLELTYQKTVTISESNYSLESLPDKILIKELERRLKLKHR